MHEIEEESFGYRMSFSGFLQEKDMKSWIGDLQRSIEALDVFGVLVDLRAMVAFPYESQQHLMAGIRWLEDRGMERAAMVVSNPITKLQIERFLRDRGTRHQARLIDASDPRWERLAEEWLVQG